MASKFTCWFFGIVCMVSFGACEKSGKCYDIAADTYGYIFSIPVTISPADTIYQVGDTISIAVSIPRVLENELHGELETVLDQNILHASWVVHLDNFDEYRLDGLFAISYLLDEPHIGEFNMIPLSGSAYLEGAFAASPSPDTVAEVAYRLRLNRPGFYWFTFGGQRLATESSGRILDLMDHCPNGATTLQYRVNNGAENNFRYLCRPNGDFCSVAYSEENRARSFDERAGYVFRVVE